MSSRLLELLLEAKVGGVSALALPAVGGTRVKTSIAPKIRRRTASSLLAADHLLAVVLLGQEAERGLNDTTTKAEHQVECALLLNVVVRQSAAILELLASEDEALLVRRNALAC
jgi:hypothetical protein